jgi:hypothetical protein
MYVCMYVCAVATSFTHVECFSPHVYVHTHKICVHTYMHIFRAGFSPSWWGCMRTYTLINMYACIHTYIHTRIQGWILAFLMGSHARLGADSPVINLDPNTAEYIVNIIRADKWSVHIYMCVCACIHVNVLLILQYLLQRVFLGRWMVSTYVCEYVCM